MEDKCQLLSQRKPLGKDEQRSSEGVCCLPEHPDSNLAGPGICSGGNGNTRSKDSADCRECLAAMAHRLAQPITALRGGLELGLLSKCSGDEYRALLEQSLQLAENMSLLIESLRNLGGSGACGGAPQCVLLESVAREVLAEMESLAQCRDLRLHFSSAGEVKVCTDPERLREAFQSLMAWLIQNSAGGGEIPVELSTAEGQAQLFLSPPRLDLQYLQIKILEDITNPGLLFSHASKNGALGWAINRRLIEGLGGKLEVLTEGPTAGCIRVRLPLAPGS